MTPFSKLCKLPSFRFCSLRATALDLERFETLLAIAATMVTPYQAPSESEAVRHVERLVLDNADEVLGSTGGAAGRLQANMRGCRTADT